MDDPMRKTQGQRENDFGICLMLLDGSNNLFFGIRFFYFEIPILLGYLHTTKIVNNLLKKMFLFLRSWFYFLRWSSLRFKNTLDDLNTRILDHLKKNYKKPTLTDKRSADDIYYYFLLVKKL